MASFSLEFKKAVVDDFNSKRYTVAQIAKRHGVSESAVYKWVQDELAGTLSESMTGKTGRIRKITEDKVKVIVEMYASNYGISVIGKQLGVAPTTVKFFLQKQGLYKGRDGARERQAKLSDSDIEAIIDEYCNSPKNVADIANIYRITESYVRQLLWKQGIGRQSKQRKESVSSTKYKIKDAVIECYQSGLYTHKDIADKYGVSTRTISRILADAGIESDNTVKMATASQIAGVLEDVKGDLKSGVDMYAICDKYNLPLHSVKKIAAGRYDNLRVTRSGEFAVSYYQPVSKKKVEPVVEEPVEVVDESVGKVIELHDKGLKISEMMRELGLTRYAITRILEDNGLDTKRVRVDKPSSGTKSDRVRDDVLAAHNEGLGAADIAARCGVSIPTVRKVLREAGVVPHKHTVETACSEPVAETLPELTPYMRGRLLDVWDSSHDLERAAKSIMVGAGEAKALLEAEGRTVR